MPRDHLYLYSDPTARRLVGLASATSVVYGFITWLSFRFQVHTIDANLPDNERPLLAVFALFGVAFVLYIAAIVVARGSTNADTGHRSRMRVVVGGAVLFRIVICFSSPIQEIDVYRYMWDGVVTLQSVSPFRYPPGKIKLAMQLPSSDPQVQRLAELCRRDPELAEVLRRVHFDQLTTPYPAVSQFVFAVAAVTTPPNVNVATRLGIMKIGLLLFDVATLWLVIRLLGLCRMPTELSIAYGWCPLVMKEIANSGHLDAIAVFFTTFAVYLFVKTLAGYRSGATVRKSMATRQPWVSSGLIAAALVLALGVGAKLYPVILLPLFAIVAAARFGWRAITIPALVFACTTLAFLSPMLLPGTTPANEVAAKAGVMAFLHTWEINDFLFMLVVENLKPNDTSAQVWFSVVPPALRHALIEITPFDTPFGTARFITAVVFLIVAFLLALRVRRASPIRICEAAFLTIAWFWLLCPTQNPWYWLWALPLLPFVRNPIWYAMSGMVMVYYLRFWFEYHCSETDVLGTGYHGTVFFDLVVTWFEFAPWLICLVLGGVWKWRKEYNSLPLPNRVNEIRN